MLQRYPFTCQCPRATVAVEPDSFYSRCFRAILAGRQATEAHTRIQEALQRTLDSPCDMFTQEVFLM
jgi:hypothetical protein